MHLDGAPLLRDSRKVDAAGPRVDVVPVTTDGGDSSSHRCASTFRPKCRACSLPASSR